MRHTMIILSQGFALFLMILFSVLINDQLANENIKTFLISDLPQSHSNIKNRQIASTDSPQSGSFQNSSPPNFELGLKRDISEEIKSEHLLANKVSKMSPYTISLGALRKPSSSEVFRYSFLSSNYSVSIHGKELNISFEDSISEGRPMVVQNRIEFLQKNKAHFPISFSSSKESNEEDLSEIRRQTASDEKEIHIEEYTLFGDNDAKIGKAIFELTEDHRLKSLKIKPLQ